MEHEALEIYCEVGVWRFISNMANFKTCQCSTAAIIREDLNGSVGQLGKKEHRTTSLALQTQKPPQTALSRVHEVVS